MSYSRNKLKDALAIMREVTTPDDRKQVAEKSFAVFFAYYFTEYIHKPFAPFHYDWFNDLEDLKRGNINELALIAFRESAKTSITKAFIAYTICFKLKNYIVVTSQVKSNAETILFDVVSSLQTNKLLIQDFGQLYNQKRNTDEVSKKQVSNFITANGIRVEASSTQESLRGRLHKDNRVGLLIGDDCENNNTKDSEAITADIIGYFDEARPAMAQDAWLVFLGNYITEHGLVQRFIDRSRTDKTMRVRMQGIYKEDNVTPSWWHTEADIEARRIKMSNPMAFSAEYLNKPIDAETAMFKPSYFKSVEPNLVPPYVLTYITIDTAMSLKDSADFTAITVNKIDKDNRWYIKSFKYKITPEELVEKIISLWTEYAPDKIGIENTAYYQGIFPYLTKIQRERGISIPIIPLEHRGRKKEDRIIKGLLYRYESGQIFHIKGFCDDLEASLVRFPNGSHDDDADSLAYMSDLPPFHPEEIIEHKPKFNPFEFAPKVEIEEYGVQYPEIGI